MRHVRLIETAEPLATDTESRIASFAELVATAIANAESRAELMASRARIVAAADETRRRIERDLHDGIQQRLGLHPAILSEGGLEPALRALRRRSAIPVELDLHPKRRLPGRVEVAAYYVVSEALTNAAKHARASVVNVELDTHDAILQLAIRDDGFSGADPRQGSGLVGLSDRIEALGGTLQITSPAGNGTTLLIQVPLEGQQLSAADGARDQLLKPRLQVPGEREHEREDQHGEEPAVDRDAADQRKDDQHDDEEPYQRHVSPP